jgi:hypothetical protein
MEGGATNDPSLGDHERRIQAPIQAPLAEWNESFISSSSLYSSTDDDYDDASFVNYDSPDERIGRVTTASSPGGATALVRHSLRIVPNNNEDGVAHDGHPAVEVHDVWEEDDDDDFDDSPPMFPGVEPTHHARATFAQRIAQPIVQLSCSSTATADTTRSTTHSSRNSDRKHTSTRKSSRQRCPQSATTTPLRLWYVEPTSSPRLVSRPCDLWAVEQGHAAIVCPPSTARVPKATTTTRTPQRRRQNHNGRAQSSSTTTTTTTRRRTKTTASGTTNHHTEVMGWLGRAWRRLLQWIVRRGLDHVNRLRLSRILQNNLHFLTAYEAYLLASVLDALDKMQETLPQRDHSDHPSTVTDDEIWSRAFANRNVSRLLVQAVASRYDFLYHWPTAVMRNRLFDLVSQIPILGGPFTFPATENFPSTRNHALASIVRLALGPGHWLTRTVTGGRQGLVTDDPEHPAQNLAAESNGFESANRNQYGTHFGRVHTNQFRLAHRLPTDESLVRTFITTPIATLTNNGVVHTLRQLAKHWKNMLVDQEFGNFAHQRMEQLDPFETLRIHVPAVLLTLSSLRGRNIWDAQVLGPFMQQLTNLDAEESIETAQTLVQQLQRRDMVNPVCGGIPTVVQPYVEWLQMIELALERIAQEATAVYALVASVELGIRLGYDIMTQVCWTVPSNAQLIQSIQNHIMDMKVLESTKATSKRQTVLDRRISSALERTTPRDKRTLIELLHKDLAHTKPAQLLLARVKTLLQREIRRDAMNQALIGLSKGDFVATFGVDDWYWLESKKRSELHVYCGANKNGAHEFRHVVSGSMRLVSRSRHCRWRARAYLPLAEAICRAQKALMTIELEHGKRFSLNAFMEFRSLRVALRRLVVVGQMACEVLDNARLHILGEIQRLGRRHSKIAPQNIIVIGGGPAGMMAFLHCTENCLASGGVMKLFEARDSFAKGGSTYERAQIVRLDARWIATMRYHLGTGFEDVWIPASGETDAQLGNALYVYILSVCVPNDTSPPV